ncbi:MAG: type II toxin-antitoxin system VapC family toxin [Planctomycetaceae bacterium]|nr:type II toxin-antitoxin system VapC family toxin [Planctomycetaceae bacterium]
MACLDTSVLLDLAGRGGARGVRQAMAKLRMLVAQGEGLVTTRISVAELYVGVWRSHDPPLERKRVEVILEGLDILDFDQRAADLFGQITAHLQQIGRPIGDLDVMIAAISLVNGHLLVTGNASIFCKSRSSSSRPIDLWYAALDG